MWLLVRGIYCDTKIRVSQVFFVTRKIRYDRRMEEHTKRERGRPPKDPSERLIGRSIRLTAAQWEKVDKYGMDWLRDLIRRARPPIKSDAGADDSDQS